MNGPENYLIAAEDIERLRRVANRLGDPASLSFDQRRDLMNLIALVVGNAIPFVELKNI